MFMWDWAECVSKTVVLRELGGSYLLHTVQYSDRTA